MKSYFITWLARAWILVWPVACGWAFMALPPICAPFVVLIGLTGLAIALRVSPPIGGGTAAVAPLGVLIGVLLAYGTVFGFKFDSHGRVIRVPSIPREYPATQVLLAEIEHHGFFQYWEGADPGQVVDLPSENSALRSVVRAVNQSEHTRTREPYVCANGGPVYLDKARLMPKQGHEAQGTIQVACLDELPRERQSAFVLYVEQGRLTTLIRTVDQPMVQHVDLFHEFPGFRASEITSVPGDPSALVIWGEDDSQCLRLLRFDLWRTKSAKLKDLLVEDRRFAENGPPCAVAVSKDFPDQAWYLEEQTGDVYGFQFSSSAIRFLGSAEQFPQVAAIRYLEVDWVYFHEQGDDIPLKGSDSLASWRHAHSYSATPTQGVSIHLDGSGRVMRGLQPFLVPGRGIDD